MDSLVLNILDSRKLWILFFQQVDFSFAATNGSVLSDELLIKKINDGEKAHFEILVERYSQKIFRYLFNYFNFQQNTAEDVLQECLVKLWDKLGKYDTRQKFEPWLYRFVHNFTVDWLRSNSKEAFLTSFSEFDDKSEDS